MRNVTETSARIAGGRDGDGMMGGGLRVKYSPPGLTFLG